MGNIFVNHGSERGLISRIYEELKELKNNKKNTTVKKWAKDMKMHFSKDKIQCPTDK